jgi:hypothetical protein
MAFPFLHRFHNVLVFAGGFVFDWLTVGRIDSWIDISVELAYLSGLTLLLVLQYREHCGSFTPGARFGRLWRYNVDALHFMYGALLSINVVFYARSSTGARPYVFFALLVALLGINELPQIRQFGYHVRLGLYAFCLATFMIYVIPVTVGRMGDTTFLLSLALSAWLVWQVARVLSRCEPERRASAWRLYRPAAAVLVLVAVLYFTRLIPPVPLSVQAQGLYHEVQRTEDGHYLLRTTRRSIPSWAWPVRTFRARPGDPLVYFVSVFAPSRFKHRVTIRWEQWDAAAGAYVTTDRIPMEVVGGRELGFRGYAVKSNYSPGRWRVRTETEDGRSVGRLTFDLVLDPGQRERRWTVERM